MKLIKSIFIISTVLTTSCKDDIKTKKKSETIITEKVEVKKNIFAYDDYLDSKSFKTLERYKYLESKKWNSNQIYKTNINNKIINVFTINSLPVKVEIPEKIGDITKQTVFYLNKKSKLDFVIEKEYSKEKSGILLENHYFFMPSMKLHKKIVNQDINIEISQEEITKDEIRIKKFFSNYLGEIAFKIQNGQ